MRLVTSDCCPTLCGRGELPLRRVVAARGPTTCGGPRPGPAWVAGSPRRDLRCESGRVRAGGGRDAAVGRFGDAAGGGFSLNNDKAFLAFKEGRVGKVVEPCQTRLGEFLRVFHTLLLPSERAQLRASLQRLTLTCGTRRKPGSAERGRVTRSGAQARQAGGMPALEEPGGGTPDGAWHRLASSLLPWTPRSLLVSAGNSSFKTSAVRVQRRCAWRQKPPLIFL